MSLNLTQTAEGLRARARPDGLRGLRAESAISEPSEKSEHSKRTSPEMVIDINKEGELIGIELLDTARVSLEAINNVLKEYGLEPLKESDLAPLPAA